MKLFRSATWRTVIGSCMALLLAYSGIGGDAVRAADQNALLFGVICHSPQSPDEAQEIEQSQAPEERKSSCCGCCLAAHAGPVALAWSGEHVLHTLRPRAAPVVFASAAAPEPRSDWLGRKSPPRGPPA